MVIIAVIPCGITDHVEKHPVKGIAVKCLCKDLKGIFLLVRAVDAGMYLPVVIHIFPLYILLKPVRVLKGILFIHLAEIKTAHHGNPFCMQKFQDPADHVFPQVGIDIFEFKL